MQIAEQMRQPHLGREKMCVMTSFLRVKQVKSYPGSFVASSRPLWMCTEGNALYLLLGCMTRAQRGCSVVRSLCALSVCLLCVVEVLGLTVHTRQQMPIQGTTFSAILSLLFHQHLWCYHSMCLLCLPVVLCFLALSFFPEGALKFDRKSGSCLLSTECPTSWSFSLFSTVGLGAGVW